MAPLDYLVLRLVRHYLPDPVVHYLLHRGLIIRAGIETSDPAAAVRRFQTEIQAAGVEVTGRRVLIFGYGGRLDVAVALLQAGARHVVAVDPYASPVAISPSFAATSSPFLTVSGSRAEPAAEWLTVVHATLASYLSSGGERCDLVLSNSVLEHVGDMEEAVMHLASATAPGGQHFHFVDLRDHFFRYPFEMLCYSEEVWRRFLNPGSNLNRWRVWDYERLFSSHFQHVSVEVRSSDLASFRVTRPRIRPEFLSGNEERDAITHILIRASGTSPMVQPRCRTNG